MDKPIAYFGYSKKGLTISFIDNSLNSPTSWAWDFGDNHTSDEENPTHEYDGLGSFVVKLIATNSVGDSDEFSMTINVGGELGKLDITLLELIDKYLPSALRGEADMREKIALIQNYQLYLQPLVEIPYIVKEEDTHNESAWPGMVNMLLAQMVTLDIIVQGANQFISQAVTGAINSEDNDSEEGQEKTEQDLKSIETGPTKTEWYENDYGVKKSEAIKNIAEAYMSATKAGGAIDQLKVIICQQASRLRIYLPMCGQLAHNTTPPIVSRVKTSGHNANPFGITKRMN